MITKREEIKTKDDFVEYVEYQTNKRLWNDMNNRFNQNPDLLYTMLDTSRDLALMTFLSRMKVTVEEHYGNYLWIYFKKGDEGENR